MRARCRWWPQAQASACRTSSSTSSRDTNVYTDAHNSYQSLAEKRYQHAVIDHAEEYVDGQVHTNGLENFWSLLKRSIKGTYVSVDPIHLFRYVDEQAYRFNEREAERPAAVRRRAAATWSVAGSPTANSSSADMLPATT